MKSWHRWAVGALLPVALAAGARADVLQARSGTAGWYAWVENGTACVARRGDAGESCWRLAPGGHLTDLAETADGWVAAGHAGNGESTELFLFRDRGQGVERMPLPAAEDDPRGRPRLAVERERLAGIVWLQGSTQDVLAVRAARWLDGDWGRPETVSPSGDGSQVGAEISVLADGRWLAVWTGFDGRDDDTYWSVRENGRWSPPRRVHEDNAVPDMTPTVLATSDGAVVAWSSFDGRDYRLRRASFDGGAWRLEPPLPGRGAVRPRLLEAGGIHLLIFRTVVPAEWVGLELDGRGEIVGRAALESERAHPPLVDGTGAGLLFRWLPGTEALSAPWEVER